MYLSSNAPPASVGLLWSLVSNSSMLSSVCTGLSFATRVGLRLGVGLVLRSSVNTAAGLVGSLGMSLSESLSGNLEVSLDVSVGTENAMNRSRNCSLDTF